MSKKINIPVDISASADSISKLMQDLNKAMSSKVALFGPEQEQKAKDLLAFAKKISDALTEAMADGRTTKPMLKIFKEAIEDMSTESKKLGTALERSTKNKLNFLDENQKKEVEAITAEINELNEELKNIKKTSTDLDFQEILQSSKIQNMPGGKDLKFGKTKDLDKAAAKIQKDLKELEEYRASKDVKGVKGKQELRDQLDAEIKLYKTLAKEVEKGQKEQVEAEKLVADSVEKTTKQIQEKQLAIDKIGDEATKTAKEVAVGLKTQSADLEKGLGSLKFKEALGIGDKGLDVFGGFMSGVTDKVKGFVTGITTGVLALQALSRIMKDMIQTIRDLDKAFNDIAMVTTYTTEEVWKMKDAFVDIANATGLSVIEVTKIAGEFFRQGRSLSETLKLTEAAGIAAKVAGIEATESVDYLTSAINGYKLSADQAMAVSDKFAALAAGSATDYEELAIALSKVAAQAYSAGVNMDNMMGFIAKALETTREAPENIGTAFKTIFARMSELKDFGKTLEDGMDINRIDTALATIGVSLTNQENELRNLDDVLIDVGGRWNSLTKNQKAYVTTALAGSRQQTRLLAIFEDFDRTMELTEMSANSLGATFAQQEKYYSSIAYAQNQLTVAWQNFVSALGSSSIFVLFYETLTALVGTVNALTTTFGGLINTIVVFAAVTGAAVLAQSLYKKSLYETLLALAVYLKLEKAQILQAGVTATTNTLTALSYDLLKTAILKASTALSGFIAKVITFLATNPFGWAILAVAAVTGIALALNKAKNKNKEFNESMRKSQAEIFNFRKKSDDLQTLLDKYNELEDSTTKTKETLEEQKRLIEQMQDLVGDEAPVVDLTGKFNAKVVEDNIAKGYQDAEDTFIAAIANTKSQYGSLTQAYIENSDTIVKQQLLVQGLIDKGTVKSYAEFLKLESNKRAEYLATQQLEYDAIKFFKEKKETLVANDQGEMVGGGTFYMGVNTDALDQAKVLLQDLFEQNFASSPLMEQIEQLKNIGFDGLTQEMKDGLASVSPEITNLISLMDKFGATTIEGLQSLILASDLSIQQLDKLNVAISKTSLTTAQQNELFQELAAEGGNSFNTIATFAEKANLGLFETLDLAQQLKDAMNNISIEGLNSDLKAIRGISDNIEKVNKMISGDAEYDIAYIDEMVRLYPEIGDAIASNAEISEETAQKIKSADKGVFLNKVDLQIKELQSTYDMNEIRIQALQNMLLNEAELNQAMEDGKVDLATATDAEIYNAYLRFLNKKVAANATAAQQMAIDDLAYSGLEGADFTAARNKILGITEETIALKGLFDTTESVNKTATSFTDRIKQSIEALTSSNVSIQNQISALNFLKNNIDKVTKATGASTKAAKEYKAALDEIYILTQQLSVLQGELDKYSFMEENAKTGEEYLTAIYSQVAALEAENEVTEKLIDAQKRSQNSIYDSLGSLKNSVTFVNGRMVPVMDKYINLSSEQQKIIDESSESYNDLSESITENTQDLAENNAEQEALLQKIEDKTLEFYDIMAEAIRAAEQEKLDILVEGLEEEQKLLDKRKEMYQKAFEDEDYNDSLSEIAEEREDIIRKIAALEGATDLASLSKRKDLLDRKKELDVEYNTTVRDFNRDALLATLDDEEQVIEDKKTAYEKEFAERIDSVEWLESEIQRILNGGLEATTQYLKDHLPEYKDAWTDAKDNIVDNWNLLYGVVTGSLDTIRNNVPDFTNMINQLQQAIGLIGQLNNGSVTPGTPGTPTTPPTPPTENKKTVWVYNGKEYPSETMATQAKGFDSRSAGAEVTRLQTAIKNAKSYAQAVALGAELEKAKTLNTSVNGRKITSKIVSAKTGGLVDYNGLAMLHGTKSKPERVLSAVQTELFDDMVSHLEDLKKGSNYSTMPIGKPGLSTGISIDNVLINVSDLTSDKNFADAGSAFARELRKAMIDRGLNLNRKK